MTRWRRRHTPTWWSPPCGAQGTAKECSLCSPGKDGCVSAERSGEEVTGGSDARRPQDGRRGSRALPRVAHFRKQALQYGGEVAIYLGKDWQLAVADPGDFDRLGREPCTWCAHPRTSLIRTLSAYELANCVCKCDFLQSVTSVVVQRW